MPLESSNWWSSSSVLAWSANWPRGFETSNLAQIAPATRAVFARVQARTTVCGCTSIWRWPTRLRALYLARMNGEWGQDELNIYGAEDDEDMEAIMKALDEATAE